MILKAFKTAFPYTIPILAGYTFLGGAHGICMNAEGFSFLYPMAMSIIVYGGALQYAAVEMLMSPFAPFQVFIMTLLIQARHIFYGISNLEQYKGLGWKKLYLIFAVTDETFSITYSAKIPEDVDRGWFMFFVTLLDYLYWIFGCTFGGIVGSMLPFDTEGITFVMTSLFVVIFMEQWKDAKSHIPAYIGIGVSLICLICFGTTSFMVPSMIAITVMLAVFRKRIEKHYITEKDKQ